ncbi:MAG: glutamate-5-semialdehyde dehydrogenase [Elusimicrobia bacterium]|jgi:glutamate-5-semialdehyde dehydrogenase|nr:glutamate-5-semialdehyde dehydrogenase [Elusimicrobiota bacterium]
MTDHEKELQKQVFGIAENAVKASRRMAGIDSAYKRETLMKIADRLDKKADDIKFRNEIDLDAAREDSIPEAMINRLILDDGRIKSMTEGIREVASLKDPVGEIIETIDRPNGLKIEKVRVPLGVIGMIYESRPNVTGDAAALCLMSSNVVILRGGSEALNSNLAIGHLIRDVLAETRIPADALQIIDNTDRKIIGYLTTLSGLVDVIIPRGSQEMIRSVSRGSSVPVIGHGKGLCHTYIGAAADKKKAIEISLNAKVQRPGVCNALETLLIHRDAAEEVLPELCEKMEAAGVQLRGDEKTRRIYDMTDASEKDWGTEYLALILSIKIVESTDEAVGHIQHYGSGHSDAIITEDKTDAEKFLNEVDSACVYVNASTRFTDGNQMGLGAEIGISNQKLHARGPMGLKELTSYKYKIKGSGQIRP